MIKEWKPNNKHENWIAVAGETSAFAKSHALKFHKIPLQYHVFLNYLSSPPTPRPNPAFGTSHAMPWRAEAIAMMIHLETNHVPQWL